MTHLELRELFAMPGVKQVDFVKWAQARGSKITSSDVSTHKAGNLRHGMAPKTVQLYRDFFADFAKKDFEKSLAAALQKAKLLGADRIVLNGPAAAFDLINETTNAFGNPDFNPDQVIEVLNAAIETAKEKGVGYGSLLAVANALASISELAKKVYF